MFSFGQLFICRQAGGRVVFVLLPPASKDQFECKSLGARDFCRIRWALFYLSLFKSYALRIGDNARSGSAMVLMVSVWSVR